MEEKIYTLQELEEIRKKVKAECYKSKFDKHGNHAPCLLGEVEMYEHDGGVFVESFKEKQWVYFTCSRCKYQWALHKLLNRLERQTEVVA